MTRWLFFTLALAFLALAASLFVWNIGFELLPKMVPTHWDLGFEPNSFTPRENMLPQLLLMPAVLVGLAILTLVLPRLSPRPFRMDEWRPTFEYAMAISACLIAYLHGVLLAAWMGLDANLGRWLMSGTCLFSALLGNVLGKVRRNFYVGVRTPWTLASDVVWERTHRRAARLFTGGGLLGFIVVGVFGAPWWIGLIILAIAAIDASIYSFVISKRLEREGKLHNPG